MAVGSGGGGRGRNAYQQFPRQNRCTIDVPQGSAIRPYLFVMLMDDLVTEMGEWAPQCILFAEDIAQMGGDPCRTANPTATSPAGHQSPMG